MNSKLKRKSTASKNKRTLMSGTDTHISKFFAQKQSSNNEISAFNEKKYNEKEAVVESSDLDESSNFSNLHTDPALNPTNRELKMSDETSTISNRSKRSKETISKFFNQSVSDNDFETPQKQPKKVAAKKNSLPRGQLKRRQMKIKTAFVRTEEAFSKLVAEQSAAENLNPDDFQMALALSRSEIEMNASFCEDSRTPSEDPIPDNFDAVKCMIRKYAFNSTEDTTLPPRKRTKWANKFTPLTMRDSEQQLKKINAKIEEIVSSQFADKINYENESKKLRLTSNLLCNLKSDFTVILPKYFSYTVDDFYIKDLFKPTKVSAGHLLKDYKNIPGRDISPARRSKGASKILCEENLDKEENLKFNSSLQLSNGSEILSDNKEISEEKYNKEEVLGNSTNRKGNDINVLKIKSNNNNKSHTSTQNLANPAMFVLREPSPDLFGDCDISDPLQKSPNNVYPTKDNKHVQSDGEESKEEDCSIATFEKYSSEEVKIYDDKQRDHSTASDHDNNCKSNNASVYQQVQYDTVSNISKEKNSLDFIDLTGNDSLEFEIISENALQLTPSIEDSNKIEDKLSQSKSIDECDSHSSGSCILISDDEVNYSMKVLSSKFDNNESDKHKSVDLTLSSSAESYTSDKSKITYKLPEIVLQNIDKEEEIADDSFILSAQKEIKSSSKGKNLTLEFEKVYQKKCTEKNVAEDGNFCTEEAITDVSIVLPAQQKECSSKNKNLSFEYIMDSSKQCLTPKKDRSFETINKNTSLEINISSENDLLNENNEKQIAHKDTEFDYTNLDRSIIDNTDCSSSNKIFDDHTNIQTRLSNSYKSNRNSERKVEGINFLENDENDENLNDETFFNLTKLKAQFGIIDEEYKELPKSKKSLSEQIIKSAEKNNFKHFRSSNNNCNASMETEEYFSDIDEIDKLIQVSPNKNQQIPKPEGIDKLLTSDLSFIEEQNAKEFVFDNKIYLVKTKNIPAKPDYEKMNSPALLSELYKNGVKPLKKKQAIIMLDYIYNQTHPCIVSEDEEDDVNISQAEMAVDSTVNVITDQHNFFNLKDCFADKLLTPTERQPEIPGEDYIFPTNKSVKIATVPLPLHLAWFNLVRSNDDLHEAILHYEPIDLQEIFLFFKKIGYRYDPKAMKKFFDSRSITFRYDVSNSKQNRHERKIRRKLSQNKT